MALLPALAGPGLPLGGEAAGTAEERGAGHLPAPRGTCHCSPSSSSSCGKVASLLISETGKFLLAFSFSFYT